MLSNNRSSDRCTGFSLIEAMVALAIVAMLAVALTRFVANTRANAAGVGEMLEMAAIVDTLLANLHGERPIKAGRIQGRSGNLAWSIEIVPVAFQTYPLHVFERRATTTGALSSAASDVKSPLPVEPILFRVAATVQSGSGKSYVIDMVRMESSQ